MKLLLVLLSVAGVSGLVWVCPALGETREIVRADKAEEAEGAEEEMSPNSLFPYSPNQASVVDLKQNEVSYTATDLVAQAITRVTGVRSVAITRSAIAFL